MEEKINKVIEKVKESKDIADINKEAIMLKLEEWREEEDAVSDVTNRFEQFWLDMEPIFAELGWV
jgi:hypothetical protein